MEELQWVEALLGAGLGLLIGSFLNVVIYRMPKIMERQWAAECAEFSGAEAPEAPKFNLLVPRSACQQCGHQIRWFENIPLVSWLALRGKCSSCGAPISVRYPLVELATGLLFFFCIWNWGASLTGLAWCGFSAAIVALAMIDWDTTLLPDNLTLPLLWAGLGSAALGWTMGRSPALLRGVLDRLGVGGSTNADDVAVQLEAANDAGRTDIDIRVAIMPTQHGESAVIRILPKDRGLLVVEKLGFGQADETKLRRLLKLPHGMIVITGPTGSGKTTTLATILSILNEPVRKILTVEDPVEYEIPGINQSQIKPAIGLTFASALRSFVRQDPDVIMVGEVRDAETAHVAVHAALTGHLVLTTLHTETAAAALPRLLDLGIEGYLLRSILRAVVAQRLVRQLCERCKSQKILTDADLTDDPRLVTLGFRPGETVNMPCGCERCSSTGYRGRLGVFEVLELDNTLRDLIGEKTDGLKVDQAAIRGGMTTMLDDGIAKCRAGLTSPAEILRVTTAR